MRLKLNNHGINYERSGVPGAQCVIMGHSLGCGLHMWDPQMPVLESRYDCIRLDMRGHGDSDAPVGPYTLEELAQDVVDVMDHLGVERAHWIGLSIGGMYGQALLLDHKHRFASAILADTMSVIDPDALSVWDERIKLVEDKGLPAIVDATMERWFTAPFIAAGSDAFHAVRQLVLKADPDGYIACCRAIKGLNYIDRISAIEQPVAVIVGAEDMATPVSASQALEAKLPNGELHVIDNASHICNVERPDAFNEIMMRFLSAQT